MIKGNDLDFVENFQSGAMIWIANLTTTNWQTLSLDDFDNDPEYINISGQLTSAPGGSPSSVVPPGVNYQEKVKAVKANNFKILHHKALAAFLRAWALRSFDTNSKPWKAIETLPIESISINMEGHQRLLYNGT